MAEPLIDAQNLKVALFCIIRNEHNYVKEYVEHYLNLGFTNIYFIDNSSNDHLDDIINDMNVKDKVFIINIRNKEPFKNNFGDYCTNLYTSLYNIYYFKYDWLAFFDLDEFLILNKDNNIKEYLSRDMFKNIDQIHINWLVFDDNDQLYYSPQPLIKRFNRVSKKYYDLYGEYAHGVKSIIRTNLNLHFVSQHTAVSNTDDKLITCDNDGFRYNEYYSTHKYLTIEYAQLNHYMTKSTEEYLNKNIHGQWNFYEKYFQINEYSEEKHNMLKSLK